MRNNNICYIGMFNKFCILIGWYLDDLWQKWIWSVKFLKFSSESSTGVQKQSPPSCRAITPLLWWVFKRAWASHAHLWVVLKSEILNKNVVLANVWITFYLFKLFISLQLYNISLWIQIKWTRIKIKKIRKEAFLVSLVVIPALILL